MARSQPAPGGLTPLERKCTVAAQSVKVFFDEIAAPVLYASDTQINAIVPYEVAGQTASTITVQYMRDNHSDTWGVLVAPVAPAIFTIDSSGQGRAPS